MRELLDDLGATDAKVAPVRQTYNASAQHYNSTLARFPYRLLAERLELEPALRFELQDPPTRKPWVLR